MFIWLAALGLLFVQPAYYRLKANGYPAQPYISDHDSNRGFCCLLAAFVLIRSRDIWVSHRVRLSLLVRVHPCPKRRRTRGWVSSDHFRMPVLSSTGYVSQTKGRAPCPLPKVPRTHPHPGLEGNNGSAWLAFLVLKLLTKFLGHVELRNAENEKGRSHRDQKPSGNLDAPWLPK